MTTCTPETPCHLRGCIFCNPSAVVEEYERENAGESAPSALDRLRAALVDTTGLEDIPEPEPLIEGIIYRDSLVWLIGQPGNGKSFVSLDMAGSVGTGLTWHDWPVTQGPVLYLVAEGVTGVKARVRAWESAAGTKMTGVYFLPVAVQATSDGDWRALVELATELRPAFIVIDTQARVTVGMEENAARDMGLFVHRAEQLRFPTKACVMIVHHQGRNGDHMRGSTALEGAATTIIKVTKDDDILTLSCSKQKDAPAFEDFRLRMVPTGSSVSLMLDAGRQHGASSGPSAAAVKMARSWWEHHANNWVGTSALIDVIAPKSTFYRHVRELERGGLVQVDHSGRYPRYRLVSEPGTWS